MKKISLVAPSYNEETNVELFYKNVKSHFESLPYELEIIFVNDGSKDKTLEKLVQLSNEDNQVKILNLARNFGKEIAMTAGIDESTGDAVIPIDVDLQDPIETITELIQKWEEGWDVVYVIRKEREGETMLKKLTAFLFYRIINIMSKIKIPKDTGDFRIMDRRVVEELKKIGEYHRFMKGLFAWVGFKQTGIYCIRKPRNSGKSTFNFTKLINFAIEGITSFSTAPLRLATYLGIFVSMFAFFYAIVVILKTIIYGIDLPGYSSVMVTVLFLGGVQLFCIGIIGEYVGRIFNETKNRPLYIIRDKINF